MKELFRTYLVVAEAPASTDVGGRFIDQTVARMREMLDEEATQPGSSREWQTEFYYDDPDKGIVVVAVKGERGLFDIAYQLETSIRKVGQDDPGAGRAQAPGRGVGGEMRARALFP